MTFQLLGLGQAALGVLLELDLSKVSDTDFVTILSRINFSGEMVFGVTYLILPKVVLAGAGLALIVAVLGFLAIRLEKQRLLVLVRVHLTCLYFHSRPTVLEPMYVI